MGVGVGFRGGEESWVTGRALCSFSSIETAEGGLEGPGQPSGRTLLGSARRNVPPVPYIRTSQETEPKRRLLRPWIRAASPPPGRGGKRGGAGKTHPEPVMELPDADAALAVAVKETHDLVHVPSGPVVQLQAKAREALAELRALEEVGASGVHALQVGLKAPQTADPAASEYMGLDLPARRRFTWRTRSRGGGDLRGLPLLTLACFHCRGRAPASFLELVRGDAALG